MTARALIVVSVKAEADAIGRRGDADVLISGVGRVNAAIALTQHLCRHDTPRLIINAGIAGALPAADGSPCVDPGETILANDSVYFEEGIITPTGFQTMAEMGFPLGVFDGNRIAGDGELLSAAGNTFQLGPIATVATCSGTDEAARNVAERTAAIAEAMEGAAVLHVAHHFSIPAVELRTISNTTGDRHRQQWDIGHALSELGPAVDRLLKRLLA